VGPRASLDVVEKIKIPSPYWELNPDHTAHNQLLYQLGYPDSYLNGGTVTMRNFILNEGKL
jgi:hypothetical protein